LSEAHQSIRVNRIGLGQPGDSMTDREVPIEVPVALEYCGLGYAVMMASPDNLEDFIVGHAVAEGLVQTAADVTEVDVAPVEGGWIVRAQLPHAARDAIFTRARTRVSDSSCGLCGVDSITEALRSLPQVTATIKTSRKAIARALAGLYGHQPLNLATGAVHAAAFCDAEGKILHVREDVGRHNALDKLIGAMVAANTNMADGFVLLSARCSFELVEKTVRAGAPMLVTISAPTSLAVERAKAAGLTLLALARSDNVLVVNDPHGTVSGTVTNMDAPNGVQDLGMQT
jgi:FdhD protein